MGDPFEKEDIVEGVDGRRERENSCRVSGLLEQTPAADCLQRPLRSRFRQRLRRGVRLLYNVRKEENMATSDVTMNLLREVGRLRPLIKDNAASAEAN